MDNLSLIMIDNSKMELEKEVQESKVTEYQNEESEDSKKIMNYYITKSTPFNPKNGIFEKKKKIKSTAYDDSINVPLTENESKSLMSEQYKSKSRIYANIDTINIPSIKELSEEKYEEEEERRVNKFLIKDFSSKKISSKKKKIKRRNKENINLDFDDLDKENTNLNTKYIVNNNIMSLKKSNIKKRKIVNKKMEIVEKRKKQITSKYQQKTENTEKVDIDNFNKKQLDTEYITQKTLTEGEGMKRKVHIDDLSLIESQTGYIRTDTMEPNKQNIIEKRANEDNLDGPKEALTGYIKQNTNQIQNVGEISFSKANEDMLEGPAEATTGYIRQQTNFRPQKTRKFEVTNKNSGFFKQKSEKHFYYQRVKSNQISKKIIEKPKIINEKSLKSVIASEDNFEHKVISGAYLGGSEDDKSNEYSNPKESFKDYSGNSKNMRNMLISVTTMENERNFSKSQKSKTSKRIRRRNISNTPKSFSNMNPLESQVMLESYYSHSNLSKKQERKKRTQREGKSVVTIDDIEVIKTVGTNKYIDTSLEEDKNFVNQLNSQQMYNAFDPIHQKRNKNITYNESLIKVSGHSSRFNKTSPPRAKSKPAKRTQLSPYKGKKIKKNRSQKPNKRYYATNHSSNNIKRFIN
jgi:hypothetical protein